MALKKELKSEIWALDNMNFFGLMGLKSDGVYKYNKKTCIMICNVLRVCEKTLHHISRMSYLKFRVFGSTAIILIYKSDTCNYFRLKYCDFLKIILFCPCLCMDLVFYLYLCIYLIILGSIFYWRKWNEKYCVGIVEQIEFI